MLVFFVNSFVDCVSFVFWRRWVITKNFMWLGREKYCFGCRKKDTCMVEARQNSDTSNSNAVAKVVAALFPRASERRVLPIVGVCQASSHLHIFSSSHLLFFASSHPHILTSSHPHIFTSSHLDLLTSSHILILTSSHFHIFSSSHLLILTSSHFHIFSSSYLPILTSSHLHILTSSHLLIFPSSHLLIFTSSHSLLPCCSLALLLSCPLAISFFSISLLKARGSANETARNATLSHEMRFDRQKLR